MLHIGERRAVEYNIYDVTHLECATDRDLGAVVDSKVDFPNHIEKKNSKVIRYTLHYFS